MTKITFLFSLVLATALFASSCKTDAETNIPELRNMYETKMDSLKITMQRAFDVKMDSVTDAYNTKIQELKVQMSGSNNKSQGVTSKPKSKQTKATTTTTTTNTTPKAKVDVNQRGQNNNPNAPKGKVDVNKRGQ